MRTLFSLGNNKTISVFHIMLTIIFQRRKNQEFEEISLKILTQREKNLI